MNKITKAIRGLAYAINRPKPPKYVLEAWKKPQRLSGLDKQSEQFEEWLFTQAEKEQEYIECKDNWGEQFELEYRAGLRDAFLDVIDKIRELRDSQELDIPGFMLGEGNNSDAKPDTQAIPLHPAEVREMLAAGATGGDAA